MTDYVDPYDTHMDKKKKVCMMTDEGAVKLLLMPSFQVAKFSPSYLSISYGGCNEISVGWNR